MFQQQQQQHHRQHGAPASPSAAVQVQLRPAAAPPRQAHWASHPVWRVALVAACVLMMLVYMHGTHHMVLAAKSMNAVELTAGGAGAAGGQAVVPAASAARARGHQLQQQQQQQQQQQDDDDQEEEDEQEGGGSLGALAQQQHQQQPQGAAGAGPRPEGCPACPQCAIEVNAKDVARLSADLLKYETPFIDTVGMRNPAFAQLPRGVVPPLGQAAMQLWRDLQPTMQQLQFKRRRESSVMYNDCDSAVLYAFARRLRPARVFEVGSGFSTRVMRKALRHNARGGGPRARHLCIEPFRHALLEGMGVEVVPRRVQEVQLELFDELQAGDLLFLDNSHVMRPYGDVIFELLWILPRLKPGVYVHLHDIFLPFEYPAQWMLEELRPYTEQYMLAAFLYGNSDWEVVLQTNDALKQVLPPLDRMALKSSVCAGPHAGSSIYLRRRLPPAAAGEAVQATR